MSIRPYGSWPSPLTAEAVVAGASTPTAVAASDGIVWWSETRPAEAGREAIVRRDGDGSLHEVLPVGFDARTRVHEYGGGAWWVHDETVFVTSAHDQRLYRVDPGHAPQPVTPEPPAPQAWRYADGSLTPDGQWVVCVRERHEGPDTATDVQNEVVAVRADGTGEPVILFADTDFVAAPRVSRDGRQLAFVTWNHPNMPWDSTELVVGRLERRDGVLHLADPRREAGGAGESLVQPEWGRHATLYVCSDRSGWWNVHRVDGVDRLTPVLAVPAEVSVPAWVLGQRRYLVRQDGCVVAVHRQLDADGASTVLTTSKDGSAPQRVVVPGTVTMLADMAGSSSPRPGGSTATNGSAAESGGIVGIVRPTDRPATVRVLPDGDELRPAAPSALSPDEVSLPAHLTVPTGDGEVAHAWFYPAHNPGVTAPADERPPLIVSVHGGPTSAATPSYSPSVQYWTSRGIAVVDVDHRGSTGYGRAYRELLRGQWCVVDVEDAAAVVGYLGEAGIVDADRVAIHGGSAGGGTALLVSLLTDVVAAAVSYFGVTDLLALTATTHKFESRYTDTLVGPMPSASAALRDRSPLAHAHHARVPTLVMQGRDDPVVLPQQAEAMVAAFVENEVPHAYLTFPGEEHGFRRAENQVRALETELAFYGVVFGFRPSDPLPTVELRAG